MDQDMTEEMRIHLEMQAAEYEAAGMGANEAMERARREFGHLDGIRETCRDERGFPWLSQLGQDVRYGLRMLRRSPGFTAAAVVTLALGIGVNTAVLSLVDKIFLERLPVRDPGGLVLFHWTSKADFSVPVGGSWEQDPETHQWLCTSFSLPTFERIRNQGDVLEGVFAFTRVDRVTVVADGMAESVPSAELVSGDCFSVLGLPPIAGRVIGASDDRPGAPPVAMLSFGFWQRRFAGDPSVIGKSILVNRLPVTVVGVTPRNFAGTIQVGESPDLYLPIAFAGAVGAVGPDQMERDPAKLWWVQMIGRLRPGESKERVQARLEGILRQGARESIAALGLPVPEKSGDLPELVVGPGGQGLLEIRHGYIQEWTLLAGLGGTVLLIACANLANLLLARGAARQREIGVRLAMGAGRGRIARQLLTESALLAAIGGSLAMPFAFWAENALLAMQPKLEGHALVLDLHPELSFFAVAALVSVATGLGFGLVPALRATRVNISAEFQGGTHNRGGGSRSAIGKALLGVQVALSLVLLVGAGLFIRTLRNLRDVDIGFDRRNILLFSLDPNPTGSAFDAAIQEDTRIAERIRAVPGVISATYSKVPVLSESGWNTGVKAEGREAAGKGANSAMVNAVDAEFFATYGIPIVRGRPFAAADETRTSLAVVINQAMAKAFFGDDDPVGRALVQTDMAGKPERMEVIGVARDASYSAVRNAAPATLYLPFFGSREMRSASATFAVRTAGSPLALVSSVSEAVHSIDPMLPVAQLRTQAAQIEDLSANERMFARLAGMFSLLALGLVSLGLYGIMSYNVLRRTSEIGLRIALGARPAAVVSMILREYLGVVCVGAAVGIAGACAVTRLISNLLFGLTPTDPLTFAGCVALLLGIAAAAGFLPARRASRMDPMVALRRD